MRCMSCWRMEICVSSVCMVFGAYTTQQPATAAATAVATNNISTG